MRYMVVQRHWQSERTTISRRATRIPSRRPAASLMPSARLVAATSMVSSAAFPNLAWSCAALPWVLWSVGQLADRPSGGRFAAAAAAVAFAFLAGEPVTFAAGTALAAAFAVFGVRRVGPWWRSPLVASAAVVAGLLLASIQLLPLLDQAARSNRAAGDRTTAHHDPAVRRQRRGDDR